MSGNSKDGPLHPDVGYLLTPEISDVLSKGLSELYEKRPSNPVEYLALWLLNISNERLLKQKKNHAQKTAAESQKSVEEAKERLAKSKQIGAELPGLCNFLQKYLGATGVYIGHVEKMRKPITDESNDKGHIDENGPQVIRYVAACDDHKFMIGQTLTAEGTVTYNVFHPNAEPNKDEDPNTEENEEKKEEVEEKNEAGPSHKFIPDVTKESRLKFFKVPKLGCYLAVSLKYNSCLYDTSLDKAVETYYETIQKKEAQAKEIQEYEEKEQKERDEKEAAGEPYQPAKVDWPKIEELPYQTYEREYVLCIDTLGQDRIFTENERKFVLELATHVVQCWEKCEADALTKDKLLRIAAKARDEEFKEKEFAELNDAVEKAGEDAAAEEPQGEAKEEEKEAAAGFGRVKLLAQYLNSERFKSELLELTKYTILKYPRVFQYALYLLGYNREEICEKGTNKLWLHKLPLLIDDKFFEKIIEYSPMGSKPDNYPKYRNINAIERNLEEVKDEDVLAYSIAYGQLLRWVKECIKTRKKDISVRKAKRQAAKEEREAKIKEKEEWEKKREEALKELVAESEAAWIAEKKKEIEEAQGEPDEFGDLEEPEVKQEIPKFEYDEATILAEWLEKNPPVEIPAEVAEEVDNDYDPNLA